MNEGDFNKNFLQNIYKNLDILLFNATTLLFQSICSSLMNYKYFGWAISCFLTAYSQNSQFHHV
jgi:hypothetical protein